MPRRAEATQRVLQVGGGGFAAVSVNDVLPHFADRLEVVGRVDPHPVARDRSGDALGPRDDQRFATMEDRFARTGADCRVLVAQPHPRWRDVNLAVAAGPTILAAEPIGNRWATNPAIMKLARESNTIACARSMGERSTEPMPTVVLIGTLDTKGHEYAFVKDRLLEQGVDVVLVDAGVLGTPTTEPDITRDHVAQAGGGDLTQLVAAGDRGDAIEAMGRGAAEIVARLFAAGRLDGALGLGGSGGSTLVSRALRGLPVGVPKLLVSTVASGDTRPYVGASDLTLMPSVVDVAGINRISERILANAAAAIAGMAKAPQRETATPGARPLVGATMFGVTTPGVTAARERLETLGYEVLVFHATGTGGDTMEALIESGFITAVLDMTTTELADEVGGGVLAAGPRRLEVAGALGIPQVVSLGALDMVNFGPIETVPERYAGRTLYKHNASITLMRTNPEENAEIGRRIARKLNAARGPLTVFVPLGGVSMLATPGGVFADPEADAALIGALREHLDPAVDVRYLYTDINDPEFAHAMADALHAHVQTWHLRRDAAPVAP